MHQVQAAVCAALPLGPQDPAALLVLEEAGAGRDAVWSLRQVPTDESQWRPLGFGGKVLPSSADNPFPFE